MKVVIELNLDIEKFSRHDEEVPKIDIAFFEEIVKNKINQQKTMHTMPVSFWSTLKLNKIHWMD